jgi:hypothetical protein
MEDKIKFTKPEVDPNKLATYGPISNDSYSLANKEFVSEEKSLKLFEIFNKITLQPALKKWRNN